MIRNEWEKPNVLASGCLLGALAWIVVACLVAACIWLFGTMFEPDCASTRLVPDSLLQETIRAQRDTILALRGCLTAGAGVCPGAF